MAFDGIVIHAIVNELSKTIIGGRIDKIYQPFSRELILRIRTRGENHQLFISADPTNPRLHLTDNKYKNPDIPPNFCMFLRKYIENSRILSITQWNLERIIRIELAATNEIGDPITYWLIAEIMGRHSNILLIDPNKKIILDCIHYVNRHINTVRELLPGRDYITPPLQNKHNLLTIDNTSVEQLIVSYNGPWDKFFLANFQGVSPLVSNELWARTKLNASNILNTFISCKNDLINHNYTPCIVTDANGAYLKYSAIDLQQSYVDKQIQYYKNTNQCVDEYYLQKAQQSTIQREANDILQKVSTLYKRATNKITKLNEDLLIANEAEQDKLKGELLTANLHLISKGTSEVQVINYYDPELRQISIPLDVRLSPNQNAQNYFKKYNKHKNSIPIIHEQIKLAEEEQVYFDTILQQLSSADIEIVADIKQELIDEGYISEKVTIKKRKQHKQISQPLKYRSSTGVEIWVGRNNKQNDTLTTQTANKNETWLHTKNIPGSHVVIRSQHVDEQTLHEAANLAAYYSKARESSNVPVDYTLVKNVKKPTGSKPGFVIYEQQKTIFVTPNHKNTATLLI